MNRTTGYCLVSIAPIRKEASDTSEIVSQLLFGELVEIENIDEPWAKIKTFSDAYEGFIDHKHIRLLREKETKRWLDGLDYLIDREMTIETPWGEQRICRGAQIPLEKEFSVGKEHFSFKTTPSTVVPDIIELAKDYLNTPYLWGGKSPFGIDCSGYTQIIYRFHGFNLPRDASEQVLHGTEVEFNEIQEGDLAYFSNKAGKVTHVGILDGKGNIYHASGHVRLDKFDEKGIWREDFERYTHTTSSIKRLF